MKLLQSREHTTAQRFLYVPLPGFGCPLTALAPLHGFKLLQPVAGASKIDRLLQIVPNVFRTVAAKNTSRLLSRKLSAKAYRLRASFDDDRELSFAIQKENQIRSRPSTRAPERRAGHQHRQSGLDLARDRGRSGYRKETEGGMECCPRRWLRHSISSVSGLRVPPSEQVAESSARTGTEAVRGREISRVGFRIAGGKRSVS